MSHGGSYSRGGDRLAQSVTQERLKHHASNDLVDRTVQPIKFKTPTGAINYGYEGTVLADICEAVLATRNAGRLMKQQEHIAVQCEILVRGFARVGIIALIDEVTGDQRDRASNAWLRSLRLSSIRNCARGYRRFRLTITSNSFACAGLNFQRTRLSALSTSES